MNYFKNILKNKIFLTIFLSVLIFMVIFSLPKFLLILDKKISYYFLNYNNLTVSDKIIIVNLDDESIEKIGSFPFKRDVYTKTIENLNKKWAWVIAFDIIFSDKGPDEKIDIELWKKIENAWNIILWSPIVEKTLKNGESENNIKKKDFILPPTKNIISWNVNYWFFNPEVDIITWEVYSFKPKKELYYKDEKWWKDFWLEINHFTIEILKNYKIIKKWISLFDWSIIPYSSIYNEDILINFISRYKYIYEKWKKIKKNNFNEISLVDVYNNTEVYKNIDLDWKIVLIWATAKGLKDIFNTPNWIDYWVYVHANIINTILQWKFLIYFNKNLEWFLILLFTIVLVYFNLWNKYKNILYVNFIFIILFIVLNLFLLKLKTWIILNHASHLIVIFILSITFSNIAKYLTENKDKKKMLKAFGEYVSKDIAEEILNWKWNINLSWERKKISIFFSDIEWFTTISEKLNPEELVLFLREYLWKMSNIIMDERGLIDKYEWDAIMALWWVFGYENSSTYDNCNSALKQQEILKKLNIDWKKRFWEELKIRMWLNTWEAIVWNIGAPGRKMEFTALWDSVNLASRLEEVNKKYGTYLCVSETVYEEQKDNFEFRFLDKIRVKWKKIPVSIYELLSKKWELWDLKQDIIKWFNIWINFYLKREFNKALEIFEKLSNLWDKPSLTYAKRCLQFKIVPPGKTWDWVWTMKSK